MMTAEENDLLCRVEGSAPMGQLMRRHWVPAVLSEELPEADGTPVPVRLFGEDLLAFRATDGSVGLVNRYCPHRRASLQFARNEQDGLRCIYHGWKIRTSGDVVEMPSEPPEACAKQQVKHQAYPTVEHGGFVWAYMGPPETMTPFQPPAFAPEGDWKVSIIKIKVRCNWAQVLEGAIDSAHSNTLHQNMIRPAPVGGTQPVGHKFSRPSTDKAPRIQPQMTDYGFYYAAIRKPIMNADVEDYVRVTIYVAPFYALIPPNSDYRSAQVNVPIDDENTMFHFIAFSKGNTAPDQEEYRKILGAQIGIDINERYEPVRNAANNYLQDRQAMKNGNFTGIHGLPMEDIAMWETMGPIADRGEERLGASDQAIVQFRRQMLGAVKDFMDGKPAFGTKGVCSTPQAEIRSFEGMMPKGADWRGLDTRTGQFALVGDKLEV